MGLHLPQTLITTNLPPRPNTKKYFSLHESILTWDENMHQEKKITHGKFFDFRAEKGI